MKNDSYIQFQWVRESSEKRLLSGNFEDKHLHSNLLPVSTSEQEPPAEKKSTKEKLKGAICQMHPDTTRERLKYWFKAAASDNDGTVRATECGLWLRRAAGSGKCSYTLVPYEVLSSWCSWTASRSCGWEVWNAYTPFIWWPESGARTRYCLSVPFLGQTSCFRINSRFPLDWESTHLSPSSAPHPRHIGILPYFLS